MTHTESILDKINKLSRMAKGAARIGNQAEAEAFAAKVQELLIRHQLDKIDLAGYGTEAEDPILEESMEPGEFGFRRKSKRTPWIGRLLEILAEAHGARSAQIQGSASLLIIGRADARAVTRYLFTILAPWAQAECERDYRRYMAGWKKGEVEWVGGFKQSWRLGFLSGLRERLRENLEATAEGRGVALIRTAGADVEAFMKGRFRTARSTSTQEKNARGYDQGSRAASNAPVNRPFNSKGSTGAAGGRFLGSGG